MLPKRRLGNTGVDVSVLGLGGFHQVETAQGYLDDLVTRYIENGGNYVETAVGYGGGTSEEKLGHALRGRRGQVILGTKTGAQSREAAWRDINNSLERLQTDHIDIEFFHGIGSSEALDAITADDGALAAFMQAREQGMVRWFGMSSHWPMVYVEAAKRLPVDAVLIWVNYLDFCNYPEIPDTVLPALREQGIGILAMKPVGDGFLYRSPRRAFRYALAQDVDCAVAGFNSVAMLETDVAICQDEAAFSDGELKDTLKHAQELGDYVCRQCETCSAGGDTTALQKVFELEGKYDRQMDDRRPTDAANHALRERLKFWFGGRDGASEAYVALGLPGPRLTKTCTGPCRYEIDIARKLGIAHAKLSPDERVELW